jgi:BCD family chlorophyll transporter-like MFS transporter
MKSPVSKRFQRAWMKLGPELLPFANAASEGLPLSRLLRLSLFQVSVGMATVLLIGTLNRVLIVEMGVSAWLVSLMVALPLVFAPFRTLVGFRSDNHRSVLGWRRVPYIWMGTMMQFGGLAIMPFALIVLSGDTHGPLIIGHIASALAFVLVGAGLQTTQTAGLALATDLAPAQLRPRVIALMYAMLLVGMVVCGLAFGTLLATFSQFRLIQVVQGAALMTMVLNTIALWKQEARNPSRTQQSAGPSFSETWRTYTATARATRFLLAVSVGTAAFNMQDIILEPYGGQILHLSVGSTTSLTAMLAGGALLAFALAARGLSRGFDPCRLAAYGILVGLLAFVTVIYSAPVSSGLMFRVGSAAIGFGNGLFCVGTLAAAMEREQGGTGLALGAWGAVQAGAAGVAIALGGALRDLTSAMAAAGSLGPGLRSPVVGYSVVYQLEIVLLFIALIVLGPLVGRSRRPEFTTSNALNVATDSARRLMSLKNA